MPQQQEYKTVSLVFANKGLVARYSPDRLPDPAQYLNLDNIESREENSLSSRFGTQSITNNGTVSTPLPASVHSLGRMKSLNGVVDRFAGAGTSLYQRTGNGNGAYTNISGAFTLSGDPWSQVVFEPLQSAKPYSYFFDLGVNLKWTDGFTSALQNGINPPNIPPILFATPGIEQIDIIETFYALGSGFVDSGLSSTSFASRVSTTLSFADGYGYGPLPVASTTGIVVQQLLNINNGGGDAETALVGSFQSGTGLPYVFLTNNHSSGESVTNNYFTGTMGSSATAYVGRNLASEINLSSIGTPGISMAQTDVFTLAFNVNNPANIASVFVQFNLGGEGVTSNIDYYGVALDISSLSAGWNYLTAARSAFTAIGLAGSPGYTWANVSSYKITVITNGSGGATVGFDDFYLGVGSQLDVTGGIPYDYRMTWYNANTGTESNPTADLVAARQVDVTNGSVAIAYASLPPSEATHWRLYRMGGSLSEAWYMVAQIPIAQVWYLDSWPDSQIVNNPQLALDNDPPVTSALVTPVNVTATGAIAGGVQTVSFTGTATILAGQLLTIDTGAYQEQVYVMTGGTSSFEAYFQLQHAAGVTITATTAPAVGVNLACVAFGQGWAAGDLSNPSTLYYSKVNNLEAWPPENTLIVGPPSDPIMGIVFYRGQLYVWTLTTVYQILPQGTSPPIPIITGSIHGLFANFGIAQGEGQLFYQGIDGIYAFAGASQLLSEIIDWIIKGETLGPVVPIAPASLSGVRAAFCDNEIFFSYTGTDSAIHRIIYSTVYHRWRNDDVPATAMLYESDTGYLIIGEANGNIYQDRVGDYDDGGWSGGVETKKPIGILLQTQYLDFGNLKADKYFSEFTLDIDSAGQNLTLTISYDNPGSPLQLDIFTVNTSSRQQVQFSINNGLGYRARRIGVQIAGSVTSAVTLYQMDVRVMIDEENRLSFDSGPLDFGTSEFKLIKQAFFEYEAPTSPITVNCYLEGTDAIAFSFTLPQGPIVSDSVTNTLGRTSIKIRFPAIKARIFRFVGTCPGIFKLYSTSFLEWKPTTTEKSYTKAPLTQTTSVK